ncbi:MAG: MurR/RpiR family transcriptional regulator [Synergistales bacterium]|nr:MurR/RpiR family transcriptional regulator [Synergistales bacterium]
MINKRGTLLNRIKNVSDSLSPKQRQLAEYIFINYIKVAFMNSSSLAYAADVSESTVNRFIMIMGYSGYSEFQADCQRLIQEHISSLEKYPLNNSEKDHHLYEKVFSMEASILEQTKNMLSSEEFDQVVTHIEESRELFIVATGPNTCLSEYASFFFSILKDKVHKIDDMDVLPLSSLKKPSRNALAIIFSFVRYPSKTQKIAEKVKNAGIPIIGITDSATSPLAPLSDHLLLVPMKYITFMDPFAPVMTLVHSLFIALFSRNKVEAQKKVQEFDEFAKSNHYFLRDEIDIVKLFE